RFRIPPTELGISEIDTKRSPNVQKFSVQCLKYPNEFLQESEHIERRCHCCLIIARAEIHFESAATGQMSSSLSDCSSRRVSRLTEAQTRRSSRSRPRHHTACRSFPDTSLGSR